MNWKSAGSMLFTVLENGSNLISSLGLKAFPEGDVTSTSNSTTCATYSGIILTMAITCVRTHKTYT